MTIARFHPQAWINNYAIEVDPLGPTEWQLAETPNPLPEADTYESDELRHDPNAPAWVRDWHGPFYIEIVQA